MGNNTSETDNSQTQEATVAPPGPNMDTNSTRRQEGDAARTERVRRETRDIETDALPSMEDEDESEPSSNIGGTTRSNHGTRSSQARGSDSHHVFTHHHSGGGYTELRLNPNMTNPPNVSIGDHMNLTFNESSGRKPTKKKRIARFSNYENEEEINKKDINIVSENIGSQWWNLGEYLGFRKSELETIEMDYHIEGTEEVVYQMMKSWKAKDSEPTLGRLIRYLHSMQRDDISQMIVDSREAN